MKIINNHFKNDNKICFGLYHINDLITDTVVQEYAKGLTLFYLGRIQEITENKEIKIYDGNSIDTILNNATDGGYKYIIFQSVGNLLYKSNIIFDIDEFINNNKFGFAGHILHWSEDKYYEIHPQFFILNLESYEKSGRPKFGEWDDNKTMLPDVERSVENFHDHYTPLWIKHKGTSSIQRYTQRGWSLFAGLIGNGFNVITLPENIRFNKLNLYFESEGEKFINSLKTMELGDITNPNQKRIIQQNINITKNIWLFNSEDMLIPNEGKFDIMSLPASGFKVLSILRDKKLTEDGKLLIYDFSEISLNWFKHFKSFEGVDIINCIETFEGKENFKWLSQTTYGKFQKDVAFYDNLKNSIDFFGGEDEFIRLWVEFKNMNVIFVQTNLIENRDNLMEYYRKNEGRKFIHISNIFSTDLTITMYGLREIFKKMNDFLLECYLIDVEFETSMFDFLGKYKWGKIGKILDI